MPVAESPKTFEDIRNEYNHLFQTEGIRDDERGYLWHAKTLLQHAPGAKNILDLACGGGYYLKHLHNLSGGKLLLSGLDISDQAIKIAKTECPSATYSLGVGEKLPYQNQTFDAISCLGSLEHFLDIKVAVGEMIRASKDNAVFYILVPNMFWYKDLWSVFWSGDKKDRNQTQERFAPKGEWIRTLEQAGLRVAHTLKYNGIARRPFKQWLKDLLVPLNFSYHFIFICKKK